MSDGVIVPDPTDGLLDGIADGHLVISNDGSVSIALEKEITA